MSDPWADPRTPTQAGAPYAGPPATAPYGYAPPPTWGAPPWGTPPYGMPYGGPWTPPPRGPQRPAQVVSAAVLAFVQAAVVLIVSLYLSMFASMADVFASAPQEGFEPGQLAALSREATGLALVQMVSGVLLVGAAVWALGGRRTGAWWLLLAAHGLQVLLAGYWLVRLMMLADDTAGRVPHGIVLGLSLFFAAGPLTSIVLLLLRAARQWFGQPAHA